jgi:enoyl-CoA hydratase/carnithine racemase
MMTRRFKEDTMALMSWRADGSVAILSMENGENRHNPEFVSALLGLLDEIEADRSIHAVVLTSTDEKNWSQGIDLNWMMGTYADVSRHDEVRAFMRQLNQLFTRLLTFPMPIIASINGHAFGDGAIMACACDFRMMKADRGFFCFPEIDINIPFLPGMMAIVKKAVPQAYMEFISLTGKRCLAPELEQNHVILKACPDAETLLAEAIDFARTFTKNRPIFAEMKRRMNRDILEAIDTLDPPLIEALTLVV